jgi:pantoate--beta-alanine ligase
MKVLHDPHEVYSQLDFARRKGDLVGLVPTMGALHEGHLSLVQAAQKICQQTVATIFVNPTQFGPNEDLAKYPRTLESDLESLERVGTNFVFVPKAQTLYPVGFSTMVDPPDVAKELEGKIRPGHFSGVATVVLKLFHLIPAQVAFFGQKDFQQSLVVRRMVQDLNVPIRIEVCPTVREPDGLAMSSRNRYLDHQQRTKATMLWRALSDCKRRFQQGQRRALELEKGMLEILNASGPTSIDYAVVVCSETLDVIETIDRSAVALIALRIGTTRLIDNELLEIA